MGNVRNPVGPLPSSIYWRRRAVVACLFAIVAALVVWLALPGGPGHGGGGHTGAQGGGHSGTPLPSITPGPTTSQTGITTEPGGRTSGGSGDGGSGDGGSGDGGSGTSGTSGGSGSGGSDSGGTGSAAGGSDDGGAQVGSGGGSGGTGSSGTRLPTGTSVPDCASSQASLRVRSVKSSYPAGQKPQFAVTAVNSGDAACKVNFSAVGTVVTITDSAGHHVWASDDCPPGRTPYLLQVPAGGSTIDDVDWNRAVSAPQCATPSSTGTVASGTYHVKVAVPGLTTVTTSFTLGNG
ncbi:hypothetical protein POF50_010070 [Streptomyces sp. SL13]|uniref:DUF4232 domain-containing protein n=1 Tax=Streptantibioticus silvisoli TaxID=2705255 RepID=A0AA90H2T6_9ACTN|nr:hypothetical protein [Streptantibioticus silvisoli]MDI5969679.1 hypothetical protein [Streptantibioticus silvisoli]